MGSIPIVRPMANFVTGKLTDASGSQVYINIDVITDIWPEPTNQQPDRYKIKFVGGNERFVLKEFLESTLFKFSRVFDTAPVSTYSPTMLETAMVSAEAIMLWAAERMAELKAESDRRLNSSPAAKGIVDGQTEAPEA